MAPTIPSSELEQHVEAWPGEWRLLLRHARGHFVRRLAVLAVPVLVLAVALGVRLAALWAPMAAVCLLVAYLLVAYLLVAYLLVAYLPVAYGVELKFAWRAAMGCPWLPVMTLPVLVAYRKLRAWGALVTYKWRERRTQFARSRAMAAEKSRRQRPKEAEGHFRLLSESVLKIVNCARELSFPAMGWVGRVGWPRDFHTVRSEIEHGLDVIEARRQTGIDVQKWREFRARTDALRQGLRSIDELFRLFQRGDVPGFPMGELFRGVLEAAEELARFVHEDLQREQTAAGQQ